MPSNRMVRISLIPNRPNERNSHVARTSSASCCLTPTPRGPETVDRGGSKASGLTVPASGLKKVLSHSEALAASNQKMIEGMVKGVESKYFGKPDAASVGPRIPRNIDLKLNSFLGSYAADHGTPSKKNKKTVRCNGSARCNDDLSTSNTHQRKRPHDSCVLDVTGIYNVFVFVVCVYVCLWFFGLRLRSLC